MLPLQGLASFSILCGLAIAQTDARLEFEVASVKSSDPAGRGTMMQATRGRINMAGVTLKVLVSGAYDVRDFQVSGAAGWISTDRYDIVATMPDSAAGQALPSDLSKMTDAQRKTFQQRRQAMLRSLLEDRFQLKIHRETKELPIYALTLAKGGSKLGESGGKAKASKMPSGSMQMNNGSLSASQVPVVTLVQVLSQIMHRTVLDQTGLTGNYDFELKWTPDQPAGAPPGLDGPPPDPEGPSIFTAIQEQLGLKLEPGKGSVEMIVIDHAAKPSEN